VRDWILEGLRCFETCNVRWKMFTASSSSPHQSIRARAYGFEKINELLIYDALMNLWASEHNSELYGLPRASSSATASQFEIPAEIQCLCCVGRLSLPPEADIGAFARTIAVGIHWVPRVINPSSRQRNSGAKTCGWPVAEDEVAAVSLHDRLGDRQAEPNPACVPASRPLKTIKGIEYPRELLL
jgi:hypothetical protein